MSVQAGLRKTLRTIWIDTGLHAQVKIYDNTAGTMVLLQSIAMTEVDAGDYIASFVPAAGVSYVTRARVYTDGTFATPDLNYAPGGEEFQCVDSATAAEVAAVLTAVNALASASSARSNPVQAKLAGRVGVAHPRLTGRIQGSKGLKGFIHEYAPGVSGQSN
jgi:hypothetical protein